jgi:hypothetical protein
VYPTPSLPPSPFPSPYPSLFSSPFSTYLFLLLYLLVPTSIILPISIPPSISPSPFPPSPLAPSTPQLHLPPYLNLYSISISFYIFLLISISPPISIFVPTCPHQDSESKIFKNVNVQNHPNFQKFRTSHSASFIVQNKLAYNVKI